VYRVPEPGLDPRGIDIDTNGVVWTALAASSHLASFDRRKCTRLTGPRPIDGTDCAERWTLYETPGPTLRNTSVPADFHYYNWVDQHNIIGLGENIPMATGSNSDSLLILNPETRQWITLRVPYPLGFYSRGMDGRIDDPSPQAAAPIDLTGYWVSVVTEDWRWRMVTPPKGDYESIGNLMTPEARNDRRCLGSLRGRLVPGVRRRGAHADADPPAGSPGTASARSSWRPTRASSGVPCCSTGPRSLDHPRCRVCRSPSGTVSRGPGRGDRVAAAPPADAVEPVRPRAAEA
jgi:hypothetical protein